MSLFILLTTALILYDVIINPLKPIATHAPPPSHCFPSLCGPKVSSVWVSFASRLPDLVGYRRMARLLCACFRTSQDDEGIPLPRAVQELIHQLPVKAISRISQLLDLTGVLSLVHTCSYLYSSVTQDDLLWKRYCRQHFMVEELSTVGNMSWYKQWLYLCKEFGWYRLCYAN